MNGPAIWIALIALSSIIVASMIYLGRKRITRGRISLPMETIHSRISDSVSLEVMVEVFTEVGKAYGIDPHTLRPEDALCQFASVDSWVLGKAEDSLSEWLSLKGITATSIDNLTVIELVHMVEGARGAVSRREG